MSNDNLIKENSKEEIIKENISCSCRDVYKQREMPDPHCFYHEHLNTLEAMLEEYAEIRAVAFAEWIIEKEWYQNQENLWLRIGDLAAYITTSELYALFIKEAENK